jgi:hypothetical protein
MKRNETPKKKNYTEEEDEIIIEKVNENEGKTIIWDDYIDLFENRSANSLKRRYQKLLLMNKTNTSINKTPKKKDQKKSSKKLVEKICKMTNKNKNVVIHALYINSSDIRNTLRYLFNRG